MKDALKLQVGKLRTELRSLSKFWKEEWGLSPRRQFLKLMVLVFTDSGRRNSLIVQTLLSPNAIGFQPLLNPYQSILLPPDSIWA